MDNAAFFPESADELATADGVAQAVVRRRIAPDVAAGWACRVGGRWVRGAGRASTAGASSFEPIFDLASLTKPMTALAFAASALKPALLLGDTLLEARASASANVPLELLLAHRAGLLAHLPLYEPLIAGGSVDRAAALRVAADARRPDVVSSLPTVDAPLPAEGTAPLYSDLGFLLVGEALARAEGARDAGEVIEHRVARALGREDLGTSRGLTEARIDFDRRVRPTEVVPWRNGEVRGVVHDENAWAMTGRGGSGHAGMFGTVDAVLAFGCAVLDALARGEGPLVGDGNRDLDWLVRPRPGGTLRAGFDGKSLPGLGSGLSAGAVSSAGARAGPRTFGHLGFTGTSLWIDPDEEAVVVLLTNRVYPTRDNVAIRAARPFVHDALFALAAQAARSDAPSL